MAVTTIARIQHRRGVKSDLPANLNEGELGWCMDTRELFIGNTSAVGGNTQILTSSSNLANIAQYTFVSDTSVVSVTGPSAAQPVVRSLQNQIDDLWVNVKAYGAQGDGITDDTAAINRAIFDLYTKNLPLTENENQTRKAVWFPSGQYLISTPLLLYPFVRLVGENRDSTKIVLTNALALQPCVLKLVDSLGQEDSSIGNNGAVVPTAVTVDDLAITTTESISVLLLQRCNNILFRNCVLQGTWQLGDPVVPGSETAGVIVETLGAAITTENINFVDCTLANLVWGAYSTDEVANLLFERCQFTNLYKGILTENRIAPDPNPNNGPNLTRVSSSLFEDIDDYGIQVVSPNPGVVSLNNTYTNVGATSVVPPILWDASSLLCASISDRFDVSPSISDLGTSNLILNNLETNLSASSTAQVNTTATATNAVYFLAVLANASGANDVNTAALLTFNPSTSRLGIGTATPGYNLHVVGNSRMSGDLITASVYRNIRIPTGTSPYTDTVQTDDDIIVIRTATDTVQVDLPAGLNGRSLTIKDGENNASVNNITVQPAGSDAVGTGAAGAPYTMNTNSAIINLVFDGTLNTWHIV